MQKQNDIQHIAIIMDGNGRWAQKRNLPRTLGHRSGVEAVKRTVKAAGDRGIKFLTLFGFSSENWKRPADEINDLMHLLRVYLRSETADLHRNNICLKVIGNRTDLDKDIVKLIDNAEALTKDNDKITVIIALNYGGRMDILKAASDWALHCKENDINPDFNAAEELMPGFLSTAGIPDPDILIRTSGEKRVSNFLLWQCAYAEMFFSETLWPDFSAEDLEIIISDYGQRDRRFGAIKSVKGNE